MLTTLQQAYAKSTPLNIVVDIPFVASLVEEMVGTEDSIVSLINENNSPHSFSLRPRSVRSLQGADLIITVAESLSPNITQALSNITDARVLNLAGAPGMLHLPSRNQHDHNASIEELEKASQRALANEPELAYTRIDPHLWLNPLNVGVMVQAIRDELSSLDPSRAQMFEQTAETMRDNLRQFDERQKNLWSNATDRNFVSLHDATYYFEYQYQLISKGSLFADTHTPAGVQQLKALKSIIKTDSVRCVVTDANTPQAWVNTLTEGLDVSSVSIDILGLYPEDANYITTLNHLADSFAKCLRLSTE